MEEIRQDLRRLMDAKGLTLSAVARGLGISAPTLSQWFSGSYRGKVAKIDEAVKGFLERERERLKAPKRPIEFVETTVAAKLFELARICHLDGEIGVAYGDSGIGKTQAAKEYAARNSDVILVEADLGYTAKVLFAELHRQLGLSLRGGIHDLFEEVVKKLDGSGRLIVVDEAEHLPYRALELLRRVYDKAGIGILLLGMPRLVNNLRGQKGEYAQLYSRVGIAANLQKLIAEDVEQIVHGALPGSNGIWREFHQASRGNTRVLSKLLTRSGQVAEISGVAITPEVVRATVQMLLV